jgi:hypothetical protein
MKGLIALPIRDTDYWHDEAVVIAADAELQEEIDASGAGNITADLLSVTGWPSEPEQPVLLVWEGENNYHSDVRHQDLSGSDLMPHGKCRLLTEHEWRLIAEGRVGEVVA